MPCEVSGEAGVVVEVEEDGVSVVIAGTEKYWALFAEYCPVANVLYVAVKTADVLFTSSQAIAERVVVLVNVRGELYRVEEQVGVLPSRV